MTLSLSLSLFLSSPWGDATVGVTGACRHSLVMALVTVPACLLARGVGGRADIHGEVVLAEVLHNGGARRVAQDVAHCV